MNPKDAQLIKRLIEKTNAKEITWTTTSKPMQFALSLSSNQLLIERMPPTISSTRYKFSILDNNGMDIESIVKTGTVSSQDPDFIAFRNLFEAARRNANAIDDTIDNILDELR